jgi:hypothetical protein
MPKSKRSKPQPLTGEVLPPPAHVSIASVAEMSPAEFLAAHGVRPPKVKAFRSLDAAMAAIVREAVREEP